MSSGTDSHGAKALQTFLTRAASAALGIAAGIVVARTLGPEGKGAYSAVQTLVAVPAALTGGIGSAITFLVAREKWPMRALIVPLAIVFAAMSLVCIAGALVYAGATGWSAPAIAFAAVVPAAVLLSWQQSFYIAVDRLRMMNLQIIAQAVIALLFLGVFCVLLHAAVPGALIAWVAANYVCAGALAIDVVRTGGYGETRNVRLRLTRLLSFGSQSSANAVLGLLNYRIDSLMLVAMMGLRAFGFYSIAVNLGEMLFLVLRPINVAVGREIGAAPKERSAQLTADTIRFGFLIAIAVATTSFLAGPAAIHAVYGGRFDEAVLPLRLLLPGIVVFGSSGAFASYFIFQLGRPAIVTRINLAMIALQSAACFALVPRFGIGGAAAASSVTYLLGAAANTWTFTRNSHLSAKDLWMPRRGDLRRLLRVVAAVVAKRSRPGRDEQPQAVIAVTGAAGGVGTLLRPLLRQRYALRLSDRRSVTGLAANETFVRCDIRSLRSMRRALRGSTAVVHLAGVSKEASFDRILRDNIAGMRIVLEAARLEGVRRVVFASSGHVTGFYPRTMVLDENAAPRPDSLYAVSKTFGEHLARYYADKFGLEVVCVRIGHVSVKPELEVDRHIWISPADLAELIVRCIRHQPLHYEVVYAVSRNHKRWWKLERSRALGFEPQDLSANEPFDARPEPRSRVAETMQGASFAAAGFDGSLSRILEL